MSVDLLEFLTSVENYKIPRKFPKIAGVDAIQSYEGRRICTSRGMWAIVDLDWTKRLADHIGNLRVLEVMAGAGWLAGALRAHGVDLVATDSGKWDRASSHTKMKQISRVERMDALSAVKRYKADIFLVSWPPYGENDITEAAKAWGSERPIIYIGESDGGCNAPSEFWDCYHAEYLALGMPQWDGLHDYVFTGYFWPKG